MVSLDFLLEHVRRPLTQVTHLPKHIIPGGVHPFLTKGLLADQSTMISNESVTIIVLYSNGPY